MNKFKTESEANDWLIKFYTYLDAIRPLISPLELERRAKLPKNALGKHYYWRDGKTKHGRLALKHAPAIYAAMAVCVPPDYVEN